MRAKTPLIFIDSREKNPWKFPLARTITKNLQNYGYDYTVSRLQSLVGIERKTLADFYSRISTVKAWKDFERNQLRKLAKIRHRLIVVEGSVRDPQHYTKLSKEALVERCMEIQIAYSIPIFFASNRGLAQEAAYYFLRKAWEKYQ